MSEQPYGQDKQKQSAGQGKNHLLAGVELQMLLVPRTDTGDADQQYRGYLAVHEMAVLIDRPSLHWSNTAGSMAYSKNSSRTDT